MELLAIYIRLFWDFIPEESETFTNCTGYSYWSLYCGNNFFSSRILAASIWAINKESTYSCGYIPFVRTREALMA